MTPCIVLSGGEEILLAKARTDLVADLVGDDDVTLVLAELDGEDYEIRELIDAAQTPPFLTDRRVVVGRGVQRFGKPDHPAIIAYLEDPLPSTTLIIEWGGSGRVPKAISDAVKACGGEVRATGPGRKVADWVRDALADGGVRPDRAGTALITDWVGEDAGKLPGLISLLVSTYGEGARISAGDIEPFLGGAGGVPPWDLTDAIDKGDIPAALDAATRMLGSGRHPLQLMATLHTHFQRILRLEGANVRGEKEAATLLGLKGSTFPAKKAMAQASRLGHGGAVESIRLLCEADLDLRGRVDWPAELVIEVLVARLARTARVSR